MSEKRSETLTWLDVNSWQFNLAGRCILVDPWLVGDLIFGNASWLIRGIRPKPVSIPANVDLLLLSQGLADHAHPETLELLDKSIPVVASTAGAKVAIEKGFTEVTPLKPGESHRLGNDVLIEALPGAPVGPLAKENAYIVTVLSTGLRIYYEPHGYPDSELGNHPPVDVAITPLVSLTLPLLGPVIRGGEGALELAKTAKPQWLLPTADGGDVTYEGLIAKFLTATGGADVVRSQLTQANLPTQVKTLRPMETLTLDLTPQTAAI
ncbi:MBL fold metallo-hydrolase [Leptothoe spongobia]|uniref:MBL fold metallo-hydrolase n=1 Tax=Leptothoe spongobia TAU-MAC 1115 TaxID=1967444 RepID=A0A947GKZ9_9CYAN|nr:MBL fold metallo-hydrolase [Leptothoe spongobia]MBT9317964.1 MBL fold metallo-hydrolase [Leptothoe spongobia TAU-MAC 1115]